jgi:hypothetical protein
VDLDKKTSAEVARLGEAIAAVARAGLALPGTVTQRHTRCGKEGCRCMADPPVLHGPYWSWTRKVNTKTTTRYLSDEQMADYRAFFENAKALRDLVAELEALSLEAIERDRRWTR